MLTYRTRLFALKMTTVSLVWIGDLDQDKQKMATYPNISDERYRPKKISMSQNQREIKIGRINSKNPPDFPIESCINTRMISRNHATIERLSKGGFMLYDHSMNGTYVNYTRVTGGVTLNQGDLICFGHLNGANLKPGESVSPFFSDLKYKVEIGSVAESKRKRRSSQPGSMASSDEESDLSDDSDGSNRKQVSPKKSRKSEEEVRKSLNGAKVKKPTKPKKPKLSEAEQPVTEEAEKCEADRCAQPKGLAVDWIQCDKCQKWYHWFCVHCTKKEADQATYHCPKCKGRKASLDLGFGFG
ncbi:Transcription factor 19 [Cichlidogyrus casuarinus]|uniref:Transcription factor 19 n=1 Tax=Cichlidogyrus casuarinus TaxID=1844966 RepID=A0ABD2QHW1_9PLAT